MEVGALLSSEENGYSALTACGRFLEPGHEQRVVVATLKPLRLATPIEFAERRR